MSNSFTTNLSLNPNGSINIEETLKASKAVIEKEMTHDKVLVDIALSSLGDKTIIEPILMYMLAGNGTEEPSVRLQLAKNCIARLKYNGVVKSFKGANGGLKKV